MNRIFSTCLNIKNYHSDFPLFSLFNAPTPPQLTAATRAVSCSKAWSKGRSSLSNSPLNVVGLITKNGGSFPSESFQQKPWHLKMGPVLGHFYFEAWTANALEELLVCTSSNKPHLCDNESQLAIFSPFRK